MVLHLNELTSPFPLRRTVAPLPSLWYNSPAGGENVQSGQIGILEGLRHLVDILVEGYARLNRRLWVLVFPIALDIFLWLGPRVHPQALVDSMQQTFDELIKVQPATAPQVVEVMTKWGQQANVMNLLTSFLTPALLPHLSNAALPGLQPLEWAPDLRWLFLLPLAAIAVGLLFWSAYTSPLADMLRNRQESGPAMLRRIALTWWRMLRLAGLVLIAGLSFLVLLTFVMLLTALVSGGLAVLLTYLGVAVFVWTLFYAYFAPDAVLLSGVGPMRAVTYSLQTVRRNFFPTAALLILLYVIRFGTIALWQRLAFSPIGVGVGIVGNAYVVSGLVMAALIYYRERLQSWLAQVTQHV